MTEVTPITTHKRVTLETGATLHGLLDLLGELPVEVPHEARIAHAAQYASFADHDEEAHDDPDFEPELIEQLSVTFEWQVES